MPTATFRSPDTATDLDAPAGPRIERVTVHHGRLDRSQPRHGTGWYVTVVEIAAGGVSGFGEAGITYYPVASAAPLAVEMLAHRVLLGADPMRNRRLFDGMVGAVDGCYHGGALGFGAVAACDVALWDLKGKLLGQPVHALLDGACREQMRAYANGWCYNLTDPADYAAAAIKVVEDGYTAMKFDPWRYDDGLFKEHPGPGNSTKGKWMRIAEERMAAVREAIGPEVDLILEAHGKFSPQLAIEIGRRCAQYDFMFYEEPTGTCDPAVMRRIADQQPIPVATGERIVRFDEFRGYCDHQAMCLAQPDVGVCGGITAGARMAEYAAHRKIGFQPHNSALGLNTAAAYQLCAALPNFIIQETFPYRPDDWFALLEDPYEQRIVDGYLPIPQDPGLGVSVDRDWLARFERLDCREE